MTPDEWRRVEELYHEALELPANEQSEFLVRASAGDEVLRRKVAALLKSHDEGGGFLDKHALEVAARAAATAPAGSLAGRTIAHYKFLELRGAGGMGEVYLADDTRLDRPVALKILPPDLLLHEDRMRRFMREAKAASALNHPNVATIYDIGESGGVRFIAMEYVEGQTLAEKIQEGPLEPAVLIEIARQVADALDAAHKKGITHRDVKPANLMLTSHGQVKVLDFGLAKMTRPDERSAGSAVITSSGTMPGIVMGTVPYMSPEQVLGKEVDHRSDIFSLGVVLYEMATGRSPFPGSSTNESIGRILHAQPEPISRFNPKASAELERMVHRCLEKDRERRYQTAGELWVELSSLQRDSGATRVAAEHVSPQTRRVAALLLFAALLAGLAFWRQPWKGAPAEPPEQRLISTFPGVHREASFSPDGNSIAFINDGDGVPQVWVKDLSEGEPRPLTSGKEGASRPRWSPKGDEILYAVQSDSNTPQGLFSTVNLWIVPPAGGVPRKLIADGLNPNWSGDGKSLVFERGTDIWIANADGTGQRRIENLPDMDLALAERRPALSPDGALIAFFQHDEGAPWGDIWIISSSGVAGGAARRLTWDVAFGGGLTWTPDGRFIVFASRRKGSMTLWKVPAAGGTPEPVLSSAGEDTDPEISHDGRRLIYTNTRSIMTLALTDPATGRTTDLRASATLKCCGAFSPAGDRIAFAEQTESGLQLFTIGTDGKNLTQITRGTNTQATIPKWSANGSALYYFQTPQASFRKIPAQGGESVEIASGWTWNSHNGAAVDPEGKRIIYSKVDRGVAVQTMIRDIRSGTEAPFALALRNPRWSSDGKFVVGRDSSGNITTCSTDGGTCRVLTQGVTPNWSMGDSRIYFDREGPLRNLLEVWSISREGGDERKHAELPDFHYQNFIDYSATGLIVWVRSRSSTGQLWLSSLTSP